MKLLGAALLWVILLAVPQTAGAGSPVLHIRVNDRHVALPRPPDLEAGVLMAPLLPLLQAFGATVAWDPRSGVLDATTVSGRTLRLQAGVRQAGLGRESRVLPVPPRGRHGLDHGPRPGPPDGAPGPRPPGGRPCGGRPPGDASSGGRGRRRPPDSQCPVPGAPLCDARGV